MNIGSIAYFGFLADFSWILKLTDHMDMAQIVTDGQIRSRSRRRLVRPFRQTVDVRVMGAPAERGVVVETFYNFRGTVAAPNLSGGLIDAIA